MASELYDLQQNKQLRQVFSLPTFVKEIAKRSDLPFEIVRDKLEEIKVLLEATSHLRTGNMNKLLILRGIVDYE